MRRITTPTHSFVFTTDPSEFDEFRITYKQNGKIVLEKTEADLEDMTITQTDDNYTLSFRLTQKETEEFSPNDPARVQVRAHYPDGMTVASDIFGFAVADVFNKEILGNE